jgi:hypothetical protein
MSSAVSPIVRTVGDPDAHRHARWLRAVGEDVLARHEVPHLLQAFERLLGGGVVQDHDELLPVARATRSLRRTASCSACDPLQRLVAGPCARSGR